MKLKEERRQESLSGHESGESLSMFIRTQARLVVANDFYSKPGQYSVLHAHPDLLHVTYTVDGTGTCLVGDQSYVLKAGRIHLVYPNEAHVFSTDSRHPFHNYVIKVALRGYSLTGLPRVIDCDPCREEAERTFRTLTEAVKLPADPAGELRRASALLNLFAFLFERASEHVDEVVATVEPDAFARVILSLQRPPFEFPGLDALARAAGMGRTSFLRRFKQAVGMAPQQFALQARLTYASHRLMVEGISVKEIATECGYANSQNFIRAYRAVYGESPGVDRRKR